MHMKLNFKRLMAMFLSIMMVVGMMPTMVFATEATETLTESNYVAQVGEEKFESVLSAITYALENKAPELKLLADSREVMTSDYDFILDTGSACEPLWREQKSR